LATSKGLEAALRGALHKLPPSPRINSQFLHRALAPASGAAGGTFGLAGRLQRVYGKKRIRSEYDLIAGEP
jgi:hypothetical protein